MNSHPRWARVSALALVTAVTVLPAATAEAKAGDVVKRGSCTGAANWKLKASPEDGRIEVEGEVDSNKAGQSWRWRILHNGSLSASGTKRTTAPSGSFSVRRVLVDIRGADAIVFKARNTRSGSTCRGGFSF